MSKQDGKLQQLEDKIKWGCDIARPDPLTAVFQKNNSKAIDMIPQNISRKHILKAIQDIENLGFPTSRTSKKFVLEYEGKFYPPKYLISLANKHATGKELRPTAFNGGTESNEFLRHLGFKVDKKSTSQKPVPESFKSYTASAKTKKPHNERCPRCKEAVKSLLEKIYGKVESNYKLHNGVSPEDFRDTTYYKTLKEIYQALQIYRGHKKFTNVKTLPRCDFFLPDQRFIVEFDESQHFTTARLKAFEKYPADFRLGFNIQRWIELCENINARDNNPFYRDEQRAWYDTLRDFLPGLEGLLPTVRIYSKETQWCALSPQKSEDVTRFKNLIDNKRRKDSNWVATVILQSNDKYNNDERSKALYQIVEQVLQNTKGDGVILLPAGWLNAGKTRKANNLYERTTDHVKNILSKKKRNIVVALGIDGRDEVDQIAIAIRKNGIEAIGRKFYPTSEEEEYLDRAQDHLSLEDNHKRIFSLNGKKYFLAVCYDSFGIRKKELPNIGIDVILNHVHRFNPKGEPISGDVYFAKNGFAGASKEWNCLVFGAAVFFKREVPDRWPTGVYWNCGSKSVQKWSYNDNPIKPASLFSIKVTEGTAHIRIYNLPYESTHT